MVSGKNILIGVTGGIASYKSAELVREFIKNGAFVKCIMTHAAKEFISPLTLSTLSKNKVYSSFTTNEENPTWNNHVHLSRWADIFIIAPTTANTLTKMCQGNSDNILIATYLSAKCPIYFATSMDLDMYSHPSTIKNIKILKKYGHIEIPAESGELASGLTGMGRMAEPKTIFTKICNDLKKNLPFNNKKILITAGPTYESIDPVRFIGNRSSGKMGVALALNLANKGAAIKLILGPSSQNPIHSNIEVIRVESAKEMFDEVMSEFHDSHIVICAAAISDYTPNYCSIIKIKKKSPSINIKLNKTIDILSHLGEIKKKQILIGFSLETNNEFQESKRKLKDKKLDMIIMNSLNDNGAGFQHDTNKITILNKHDKIFKFELKSKHEVANDIIENLLNEFNV